jgi:translocation and assembly module TamB
MIKMTGSNEHSTDKERRRPPARRRFRWAIPLLLVLLLLLFFAPAIATSQPVLGFFLDRYNAGWSGRIEVGRAKAGWSSPLTLDNVNVYDAEGESILSVPHAESDRSFWSLLTDRKQLGNWTLDAPVVRSTTADGILHIEPLLQELFPPSDEPGPPISLAVTAEDARIELMDLESGNPWIAEGLTIHCVISDGAEVPFQVEVQGLLSTDSNEPSGEFDLQLAWSPQAQAVEQNEIEVHDQSDPLSVSEEGDVDENAGAFEATITAERFPLSLLNILFARNGFSDRLNGDTHGVINVQSTRIKSWRDIVSASAWRFSGDCEAEAFEADLTSLIEPFRSSTLRLDGTVVWAAPRINFHSIRLESDQLENEFEGVVLDYDNFSWFNFLQLFSNGSARIEGSVDLARLAATLPQTLKIREGMTITSGRLTYSLGSVPPTGPPPDTPDSGGVLARGEPIPAAYSSLQGSPFSPASSVAASPPLDPATLRPAFALDQTLRGDLEIVDIQAIQNGRRFAWEQPISIDFMIHHNENSLEVEHFLCEADFLTANLQGNRSNLNADMEFDLGKLAEQANQFLDLDQMTLHGVGRGRLTWTLDAQQHFRLEAGAAIQNFLFQPFATKPALAFNEPVINAQLTADGRLAGAGSASLLRCENAVLVTSNDNEQLVLQFTGSQDVESSSQEVSRLTSLLGSPPWNLTVEANGSLSTLQSRLAALINSPLLKEWRFGGTFQTQGVLEITPGGAVIDNLDTSVSSFVVSDRYRILLEEPQASLLIDSADWDTYGNNVTIDTLLLQDNSALASRIESLSITFPQAEKRTTFQASGACSMSASLDKTWPLIASFLDLKKDTSSPTTHTTANPSDEKHFKDWNLTGLLRGDVGASRNGDATAFHLGASVEGFTAQGPKIPLLTENMLRLEVQGEYRGGGQVLNLASLTFASETLAANGHGELLRSGISQEEDWGDLMAPSGGNSKPKPTTTATLTSNVTVSWPRVVQYLRPKLGVGVSISGVRENSFTYQGPLTSLDDISIRDATSDLQFGWEAADFYGFVVGPSNFHAVLNDGVLQCDPQQLAVSEGVLHRLPSLVQKDDGSDWDIVVEPGMFIENVRINPRMAANGLQYVAPIMAGVTEVEGSFSINLADCRIPLNSPKEGELRGQLIVHNILLGPGPMIRQFATMFQFNESIPIAQNSVVDFWMEEERIHHENLIFMIDNARVYTSGSVGLDKTLELTAVMPIPDSALPNDPRIQQALRGQTITIPITGTLSSPRFDKSELENLLLQAAQDMGIRYLENEFRDSIEEGIGRGLQDLFGP